MDDFATLGLPEALHVELQVQLKLKERSEPFVRRPDGSVGLLAGGTDGLRVTAVNAVLPLPDAAAADASAQVWSRGVRPWMASSAWRLARGGDTVSASMGGDRVFKRNERWAR